MTNAKGDLTAVELRSFRQAVDTWQWTEDEADFILARGMRRARENKALLAAGEATRDSLSSRFRWRDLREEACAELGT